MNENDVLVQQPVENQQSQETSTIEVPLENTCSIDEKIEDLINERNNVVENLIEKINENSDDAKEVNNLSLSLEEQNLQKLDDTCMEVDSSFTSLENKTSDYVVIEESTNIDAKVPEADSEIQEAKDNTVENQEYAQLIYEWTSPKLICKSINEFKPTEKYENFTKGCFWAPDGTCLLVPSEDNRVRIFDVPQALYSGKLPNDFNLSSFESSLNIKEGGTVYDVSWFPYMNSWDPSTCCFLSTSQGSPIHLWDAFTKQLRATYRAYNQVDEVEAAISVQFTDCGGQIWSGFKNALRTFDTNIPGRQTNNIYLKKDFPNVTGVVSCIRENPAMPGLIAFGTYSKCIGLYKDGPLCSFKTSSGVTQIEFSPCGTKLYSAVRRNNEFLCWDLRNPGVVLYSLQNRQSDTNQRIHYSLSYSGEEIISGGTDGAVRVWRIPNDLQINEDLNPCYKIKISKDCVNGVNLHKNLPILAISTGSRICEEEEYQNRDNSVRFYWLDSR